MILFVDSRGFGIMEVAEVSKVATLVMLPKALQ